MGIRFHCPNGHKLNVKAFLAGKKGVCPKCGTRVQIPTVSEPGLEDSELEEAEPNAQARGPQPAAHRPHGGNGSSASHRSPVHAAAGPLDPIAEAPAAVWYVRPPNGMQYGPARGDVMRQWIAEGRVSGDSLVWREGWPDWRAAGQLFPALQPPAEIVHAAVVAPVATTARFRSHDPAPAPKRKSQWLLWVLVGSGILVVAVGALVYALLPLR